MIQKQQSTLFQITENKREQVLWQRELSQVATPAVSMLYEQLVLEILVLHLHTGHM